MGAGCPGRYGGARQSAERGICGSDGDADRYAQGSGYGYGESDRHCHCHGDTGAADGCGDGDACGKSDGGSANGCACGGPTRGRHATQWRGSSRGRPAWRRRCAGGGDCGFASAGCIAWCSGIACGGRPAWRKQSTERRWCAGGNGRTCASGGGFASGSGFASARDSACGGRDRSCQGTGVCRCRC